LFVRVTPRARQEVIVKVRSMLGSAVAMRDVRVWGSADSCMPSWQPLLRSKLPVARVTTGELFELVSRYPNSGRAWLGLARRASQRGRNSDARALLRTSLVNDPRRTVNWVELGLLRDADGDFASALDAYTRALHSDSNSAWARGCMAWARLRSKHGLVALYHGWYATSLDPEYADAYTISALIVAKFGMKERAAALLARAMELDPRRSWAFIERARALDDNGRHKEALDLMRRFVSRVPDDEHARRMLEKLGGMG